MPLTVVDLLRHGEPVGGRRYRGHTDDPLSDAGWRQMRAAVSADERWDVVVTSPLRRCHDFAAALAGERGTPLLIEPRFSELRYGQWEGLTPEALHRRFGDLPRRFFADPVNHPVPEGEPVLAFLERIDRAWQDLERSASGQRVLLVTHAGVIRASVLRLLGGPPASLFRVLVEYASRTRIRIEPERPPALVAHGCTT